MNDFAFSRELRDYSRSLLPVKVTDAAGMGWGHSNPAELYRWIRLRNDLLRTIAVAFPHATTRPQAS